MKYKLLKARNDYYGDYEIFTEEWEAEDARQACIEITDELMSYSECCDPEYIITLEDENKVIKTYELKPIPHMTYDFNEVDYEAS